MRVYNGKAKPNFIIIIIIVIWVVLTTTKNNFRFAFAKNWHWILITFQIDESDEGERVGGRKGQHDVG